MHRAGPGARPEGRRGLGRTPLRRLGRQLEGLRVEDQRADREGGLVHRHRRWRQVEERSQEVQVRRQRAIAGRQCKLARFVVKLVSFS